MSKSDDERRAAVEQRLAHFTLDTDMRKRIIGLALADIEDYTANFDPRCKIGNPRAMVRRELFEMLAAAYLCIRDEIMPGLEHALAETEILED